MRGENGDPDPVNVLIVPKRSVAAHYTGGVDQFRADWMGGEDEHLFGFCSMGHYFDDLLAVLGECERAFGEELFGLDPGCEWLDVGGAIGSAYCWLKGTSPGKVADPLLL